MDNNTPIAIGVDYNKLMDRWDLHLLVGNFTTEAEAKSVGKRLSWHLEREFDVEETYG